jgi:putative N6-adenine-specific DNA methylase
LLATHRKPGLLRYNFAFQHLVGFDDNFYRQQISNLKQQVKTTCPPIIATDISPQAIEAARANARNAGVEHLIHFKV